MSALSLSLLLFAGLAARAGTPARDVPITPAPTDTPGVTVVTREPRVNAVMGLKMVPVNERGDSLRWWDRRQAGGTGG